MRASCRASYASSRPPTQSARMRLKRASIAGVVIVDASAGILLLSSAMLKRRTPWVLVLAAVVLLGALDLHLADESHEFVGAGGLGAFSRSAKHPNAPAHFEQFEAGERPDCPFCLHQLRISGAHLRLASRLATPMVGN